MYERSRKRQNRRGGHNRGACPVTQENPSTDTAPTPEKRRVKKPLIIGVAVVAIAAAAILGMSVFSPQAKADKLYEQWSITIHKGDTSADYSASCKAKILGKTINETGSGKLDLPSYTYGKEITFDDYENTGTVTGTTLIKKNSSTVAKMIQKGLIGALQESGTDATLADLGFTSL